VSETPVADASISAADGSAPIPDGSARVVEGSILMPVSDEDMACLREQLGRPARGVAGIAARCVCGRPLVVRTFPRLPDGTPFPTTYYLTHPRLTSAASTLEQAGVMREMTARLTPGGDAYDEALAAAYLAAHESYLEDRAQLGEVPEIEGISAGGMPTRVKCLHSLMGHALARPGVNPLGEEALALAAERGLWQRDRCTC
jgi:hypothetical protein